MLPREFDHLADGLHEFGVVVVLVRPFFVCDFVDVIAVHRFLVVRHGDVLFGNLDLLDVLHRREVQ